MYEIALTFSVLCFLSVTFAFVRSSAFSVFHPLALYIVLHGFLFVFRPIMAWSMDFTFVYRLYQFTPSTADKITAICVANIGFLVFAAACWRAGNRPMAFKLDRVAEAERVRLTPLLLLVAALCLPIGVYSLSKVWSSAVTTGFSYAGMVRDAATGITINAETNGYVVEAQLMLATCAVIIAWLFRFSLIAFLPLVMFIVFRAGTGGRSAVVAALGAVGLLYLYEKRRRWPSTLVMVALPAIALLFSTVGSDRGASIRRAIGSDMSADISERYRSDTRPLEGMDFANLEYLEYLVYMVPQRSGTYGYFNDLLQIFTEPVPRALWPGKPVGAPFSRFSFFDYGKPIGMTRSMPGEGWYSLGWAGVVAWCAFCGFALGTIYRRFVEGPQSTFKAVAYMIFLASLIVSYRDGQLVTVFRQGLFFMAPIVLWWLLARGLGVPALADVRAQLARHAGFADGLGTLTTKAPPALPPAVLRRRLALTEGERR